MAHLMGVLRERDRYQQLLRRLDGGPEIPLRERKNPFHIYKEHEFLHRYRFRKESALRLIDSLTPALQRRGTRTQRAALI